MMHVRLDSVFATAPAPPRTSVRRGRAGVPAGLVVRYGSRLSRSNTLAARVVTCEAAGRPPEVEAREGRRRTTGRRARRIPACTAPPPQPIPGARRPLDRRLGDPGRQLIIRSREGRRRAGPAGRRLIPSTVRCSPGGVDAASTK
ncbi:hypothetical protein GQ55_8G253600 [Panicum hallii var. hallii]|uniref:Uncharacterized protein n=1 Tax=Panicum hallii var. hallii TaxID=1504633 RepID=A0A2T7CR22_9POAL|nr:hypothetical protein GQ55_8G253600 [Panicum hallii var. hallii]